MQHKIVFATNAPNISAMIVLYNVVVNAIKNTVETASLLQIVRNALLLDPYAVVGKS